MTGYHIVQQGEHITSIAVRHGFRDYGVIWDHPKNAELKEMRPNPNVLYPGDEIYIPEKQTRTAQCPTGMMHRFQVCLPKLELRLRLLNVLGKPLINTSCRLDIDGQSTTLVTNAEGRIQHKIPVNAHDVKLVAEEVEYSLRIGELDPVGQDSGMFARLNNMGYYIGDANDVDPDDYAFALSLFELDTGLEVTGESASGVAAKLEESHGC